MLLIRLVLLYAGLCFRGSSGESCSSFQLKRHHFNKRLVGYVSKTASNLTLPECSGTCMMLPYCRSLNYDGETQICEHNAVNSTEANSTALTTDLGWTFSDVTEWPKEIAGTCADNPCGQNRLCLPTTPTNTCILAPDKNRCKKDADCRDINGVCLDGQCKCPPDTPFYTGIQRCAPAPDKNLCKRDADCREINGICLDNQCKCPSETPFSTGIQRCAPVFILTPTMGKYDIPNLRSVGLLSMWRIGTQHIIGAPYPSIWPWRRTAAICSIINPEYRFGGNWKIFNVGEMLDTIEIIACSDESAFKNCKYRGVVSTTRVAITCYTTDVRGMIRLSPSYYENSSNPHHRLEVKFNGEWGSVCADSIQSVNRKSGPIACQSLQKSDILSSCYECAGGPGGPFAVSGFLCKGDEPHLLYCGIYGWNPKNNRICRQRELGLRCRD